MANRTNTEDQVAAEQKAAADAEAAVRAAVEAKANSHTAESVAALAGAGQPIPTGWAFDGVTGEFFQPASIEKTATTPQVVNRKD